MTHFYAENVMCGQQNDHVITLSTNQEMSMLVIWKIHGCLSINKCMNMTLAQIYKKYDLIIHLQVIFVTYTKTLCKCIIIGRKMRNILKAISSDK